MQPLASPASPAMDGFDSINIKKSEDLAYWVRALGVSEAQLRVAVAAVGTQVDDVRNHFGVVPAAGQAG